MQLDARYAKRIVDGERYIASARVKRFDVVLPPQNSCSHSCERRVDDIRQFVGRTIRQLFVFFKIDSLVGVYTFSDKRVDAELPSGGCNRSYIALYFRLPRFVAFYKFFDLYERYEDVTRRKHFIDLRFCYGVYASDYEQYGSVFVFCPGDDGTFDERRGKRSRADAYKRNARSDSRTGDQLQIVVGDAVEQDRTYAFFCKRRYAFGYVCFSFT